MKTQSYLSEIKFLVTGLLIFVCAITASAQPGNLDQTFQTRVEQSGAVRQAAVQPDGKIIIIGEFGKFNETARNTIARVNADGSRKSPSSFLSENFSRRWTKTRLRCSASGFL